MTTLLYFDGLCEARYEGGPRNPGGLGCYGWLIKRDNAIIASDYGCLGDGDEMTNNIAEYAGLIVGLEYLIEHDIDGPIAIRGDSQLVIFQLTGYYRCKSRRLIEYYQQALKLLGILSEKVGSDCNISLGWIPRDENQEADELSRKAYDEALK